jgi:hypothetical protein
MFGQLLKQLLWNNGIKEAESNQKQRETRKKQTLKERQQFIRLLKPSSFSPRVLPGVQWETEKRTSWINDYFYWGEETEFAFEARASRN